MAKTGTFQLNFESADS